MFAPSLFKVIPLICKHHFKFPFCLLKCLQLLQIDVIIDCIYFIIQVWMIQCWQLEPAFKNLAAMLTTSLSLHKRVFLPFHSSYSALQISRSLSSVSLAKTLHLLLLLCQQELQNIKVVERPSETGWGDFIDTVPRKKKQMGPTQRMRTKNVLFANQQLQCR